MAIYFSVSMNYYMRNEEGESFKFGEFLMDYNCADDSYKIFEFETVGDLIKAVPSIAKDYELEHFAFSLGLADMVYHEFDDMVKIDKFVEMLKAFVVRHETECWACGKTIYKYNTDEWEHPFTGEKTYVCESCVYEGFDCCEWGLSKCKDSTVESCGGCEYFCDRNCESCDLTDECPNFEG